MNPVGAVCNRASKARLRENGKGLNDIVHEEPVGDGVKQCGVQRAGKPIFVSRADSVDTRDTQIFDAFDGAIADSVGNAWLELHLKGPGIS